jgi:hypothetical protein
MSIFDKKECFGSQARDMLFGDPPDKCMDCEFFEKCHKITVAASLQNISDSLELFIQNGLTSGMLKGFQELEKINKPADKKPKKRDN